MEHERNADTKSNMCARCSHKRFSTGTGGLGDKRTNGNHLNCRIVELGQDIEKS